MREGGEKGLIRSPSKKSTFTERGGVEISEKGKKESGKTLLTPSKEEWFPFPGGKGRKADFSKKKREKPKAPSLLQVKKRGDSEIDWCQKEGGEKEKRIKEKSGNAPFVASPERQRIFMPVGEKKGNRSTSGEKRGKRKNPANNILNALYFWEGASRRCMEKKKERLYTEERKEDEIQNENLSTKGKRPRQGEKGGEVLGTVTGNLR